MSHKERRIIEGRYLRDILDQPQALEATFEKMQIPDELALIRRQLQDGCLKRIVLTGMGSSFYGLTPAYLTLRAYGYEVITAETSELIHYLPGLLAEDSLLVVVSQSGRSAETLNLLEKNRKRAKTVAVTNSPWSPLALRSDVLLLTHAGEEFSVSSKTYVTALIVLEVMASYLCNEDQNTVMSELREAANLVGSYLANWKNHVAELADCLEYVEHIFFLGRGRSLAAAGTGALITKESVRVHAEAMSSASFRHGPMEMLTDRMFVAVFEGAHETKALNEQLVKDIRQTSSRSEVIGVDTTLNGFRLPSCSIRVAQVMEILPLQMVTLALASRSGMEAGNFLRATKITAVE